MSSIEQVTNNATNDTNATATNDTCETDDTYKSNTYLPSIVRVCFVSGIVAVSLSVIPLFIPLSVVAILLSIISGAIGWYRLRRTHALGKIYAGWILSLFAILICGIWGFSFGFIMMVDPTFRWNI